MTTHESESAFHYAGRDLEAMSFAENYHSWILAEFRPYLGAIVAEIGAGSGNVATMLLRQGVSHLIAVEPSAEMYPLLREHFGSHPRVTTHQGFWSEIHSKYSEALDSLVYVNVLEHIRDDSQELTYAMQSLKPGGHLCLFVPALPWLYSRFDASVGHHRRYEKEALRDLLEGAAFDVVRLRYMDSLGILPWFFMMKLLERELSPWSVRLYDRWVVPALRSLESRVEVPIGKNLLAVARKPT